MCTSKKAYLGLSCVVHDYRSLTTTSVFRISILFERKENYLQPSNFLMTSDNNFVVFVSIPIFYSLLSIVCQSLTINQVSLRIKLKILSLFEATKLSYVDTAREATSRS